jgi:type 1 glutamine amidotransferase
MSPEAESKGEQKREISVLMVRHSAGFEHSYLPDAEVALKALGRENGWKVVTTHRLKCLNEEELAKVDVLVFATTGNLPLDDAQKKALLGFVRGGKGFVGIHNAADTCYEWPEYGELVGGYFSGHPWTQKVGIIVENNDHPATRMLEKRFEVYDEIFTFKSWSRDATNVLMRIDNETVDLAKGNRDDQDYAMGWYHEYGSGRVIYTALGHPDELWHQPWFRDHIRGCVAWAARLES